MCFGSEIDSATLDAFDKCFGTCLGVASVTCEDGCALFSQCVDTCGASKCKSELVDVVNCHIAQAGVDCTCASAAIDVSSIKSFALNLATTLKSKKNNLRA